MSRLTFLFAFCSDRFPRDTGILSASNLLGKRGNHPKDKLSSLRHKLLRNSNPKRTNRGPLMTANEFILLVDDDENDVLLLQRAFKKAGLHDWLRVVTEGQE